MLVVIVCRKPYLNDLESCVARTVWSEESIAARGTNNALELILVVSELLLWVAAMGNDAIKWYIQRARCAGLDGFRTPWEMCLAPRSSGSEL